MSYVYRTRRPLGDGMMGTVFGKKRLFAKMRSYVDILQVVMCKAAEDTILKWKTLRGGG